MPHSLLLKLFLCQTPHYYNYVQQYTCRLNNDRQAWRDGHQRYTTIQLSIQRSAAYWWYYSSSTALLWCGIILSYSIDGNAARINYCMDLLDLSYQFCCRCTPRNKTEYWANTKNVSQHHPAHIASTQSDKIQH